MDQSMMSGQETGRKAKGKRSHEFPLNLSEKNRQTAQSKIPSNRYELVVDIFKLIDLISESQRIDVVKEIAAKNITKVLRELVLELPSKDLGLLQEELEKSCQGKRAHPRKECILTVDYLYGDRPYCDFVKDVSEGGAFIYTQMDFEREDEIELGFFFPDTEPSIKFTGEVVRSDESGVGIRFIKQSNYKKEILKSILNKLD